MSKKLRYICDHTLIPEGRHDLIGYRLDRCPSFFSKKPMKLWLTQLQAIDPADGELKTWAGESIPGLDIQDAIRYCKENGLGYLTVLGELVGIDFCVDERIYKCGKN